MKRMASVAAVSLVVALSGAVPASAEPSFRELCRQTDFRLSHIELCRPYYGGGGTLPGDRNNRDGRNGGGLIGGLVGGLTGGLL